MPDTSPLVAADPSAETPSETPSETTSEPSSAAAEPSDAFRQAVAEVIKVVRPAIQADQGDIFLREVDPESGLVLVELVGACVDCPASSQTLKQGLERILKQRVEGVTEVRHIGEELAGFEEGTRVSL